MTLFHYLTPSLIAWEIFVSLSLLGFGLAVLRLLRRRALPVGIALCAGIAAWLLLGGLLNLLQLATKPVLWASLACGLVCFLLEMRDPTLRLRFLTGLKGLWLRPSWARAAASLLILWFSLCFLAHLGTFAWNRFDDLQGYSAFAEKASALGGLTPDPFSERRITSGVGGALFLNVTMLAGAGGLAIDYIEGSLGLLVLLLLAGSLTRTFRLSPGRTLAVFFALAVFTFGRANISSVNLSAAMFLALLLLQMGAAGLDSETWASTALSSPVLTGILVGAAFTLKSSNIPFCVLFLLGCAAAETYHRRIAKPLIQLTFSALTTLVFVAPWAVKHRLDEGTALFPSLGRGYHLSAYGFPTILETVPRLLSFGASLPDFLPPLLAGLLCLSLLRNDKRAASVVTFLLVAALAAPLFSVAVGAEDIDRFLLPILNLCAILFLTVLLSRPRSYTGLALFAVWVLGFIDLAIRLEFFRDPGDLALLFGNRNLLTRYETDRTPAHMLAARGQVQRAQHAIPAGATLLEEIQDAYAFDWHRNPVLLADYPGMASPPPGLPLDGSAAQFRIYLQAHGVHYLMLDRTLDRNQYAGIDYSGFRRSPMVHPGWHSVMIDREVRGYQRMEFQVAARTQQLFNALATPTRVLYDDGQLQVVALDKD